MPVVVKFLATIYLTHPAGRGRFRCMKTPTKVPATLLEAIRYFSDPDVCLVCPRCDSARHSFLSTRRVWKCLDCKRQFSIKVGTIFEDSPLGLDKWLAALWMIVNCKNGVSSYEIARALG
ncbi:MAG: hypothetical protein E6K80_08150, partial [Candidatus Eisenbacteria bacterium]